MMEGLGIDRISATLIWILIFSAGLIPSSFCSETRITEYVDH